MIIKIIDWMSRIMAVTLAISFFIWYVQVMLAAIDNPVFSIVDIILLILSFATQLGLFLAPIARQRGIICRLGIAILMTPSFVLVLIFSLVMCGMISAENFRPVK